MNIKKFRRRRGLTLSELARRSGVDLSILSRLESGKRRGASYDTTIRIARALRVHPELLRPVA